MSGAPANRYGCAVTTAEPAPAEPAPAGKPPADVTEVVPFGLRVTAAFAWRLVVVAAAIGVVVWLIGEFALLATTLAIGLLLTALVTPLVELLVTRARFPRGLAVAVSVITGLALLGGVMTFVIVQFADGLPALQQRLNQSLDEIKNWLTTGPLAVETKDINEFIQQIFSYIQENQASITTSAITTAGAVGEFLTGFLLVLFILIFFLLHGASIWKFLLHVVRATIVVAVVDAVGIGVGLAILGVPLVVPLATLVFLGAFVPIIGSLLAGSVAVLIALVTVGWVKALIALGVVTAVMQLEGHVLQPLLLGRAVRLHPLAVILAITGGLVVAGIAGALLAVPLLAVINAGVKSLRTTNSGEIPDPEAVESS
jgi:predicted PurR-regulated permease PerM